MTRDDDWRGPMKDLVRSYNEPPDVPRDEMWTAIVNGLAREDGEEGVVPDPAVIPLHSARRAVPWLVPTLAAAALLVLGIAVGRWSALLDAPTSGPGAGAPSEALASPGAPPFKLAAAEYLTRTEALVTLFRADARSGRLDPAVRGWARGLLGETRVLMESKQANDPGVRALLEDLELVLVQISQLPGEEDPRLENEVNWIGEDIEAQAILPRVQAVLPAGPVYAGI